MGKVIKLNKWLFAWMGIGVILLLCFLALYKTFSTDGDAIRSRYEEGIVTDLICMNYAIKKAYKDIQDPDIRKKLLKMHQHHEENLQKLLAFISSSVLNSVLKQACNREMQYQQRIKDQHSKLKNNVSLKVSQEDKTILAELIGRIKGVSTITDLDRPAVSQDLFEALEEVLNHLDQYVVTLSELQKKILKET
jgi:hypothetical protein